MGECHRPALAIEHRAQFVIARRPVGRVPHIVFARPQHLDRRVRRLRDQRGLDAVVVLQPPAKPSAHQRDIHLHLVGIQSDRLRHRVANILWHLRRRPQFTIRSAEVRRAIAGLHRSVSHQGKLIFRFDAASRPF